MPSAGIRATLRAGVSAGEATKTVDNRRTAQDLSMAFESRDGEAKQGIFGPAKTVSEAWPKTAKNFTVSLPLSLGVIKKEPLDGVSYR